MNFMPATTYSSGLSGKGALLEETLTVLQQIDQGLRVDTLRDRVMDNNLLGKTTDSTRRSVWDHIHLRYLSDPARLPSLARMVVRAPDRQSQRLVLLFEMCWALPLLHDIVIHGVYPRYRDGLSAIDKADIQAYFDSVADAHPELGEWSPQTREKVASNALSTLRDLGLLEGGQRKQFARVYVSLPAFVYVLYRLWNEGLQSAREVIEAPQWCLFFLETEDVIDLLTEATAAGHCTFKHRGDVISLDLTYPSLEACVEALTGQV